MTPIGLLLFVFFGFPVGSAFSVGNKINGDASSSSSLSSSPCCLPSPIHTLILTRHGDSIWNGGQPGTAETFTGWTDVPLSERGIQEAKALGQIVATHYPYGGIDACFTSVLQRAQLTAHYCLWAFLDNQHAAAAAAAAPQRYVMDYRLNERHYGALQGLVKADVERDPQYEAGQVQAWRRSWHAVPPLLSDDNKDPRRQAELRQFLHYCAGDVNAVPRGESLAMVAQNRIQPLVDQVVTPILNQAAAVTSSSSSNSNNNNNNDQDDDHGATGLIVAHANSLRALIGVLCHAQDDPVSLARLEAIKIPTAVPLVLRYRQLAAGRYQVCEIPGLDDNDDASDGQKPLPHLPLWPLSAIPRGSRPTMRRYTNNHDDNNPTTTTAPPSIGEAAVMSATPRPLLPR